MDIDTIIQLFVILVLLIASYRDLKYKKLPIGFAMVIFIVGSFNRLIHLRFDFIIPSIFLFGFGYYLWKKNCIGGADVWLLPAVCPALPFIGLGSMFFIVMAFIILFGVLSVAYAKIYSLLYNDEYIPLIPIILLAYIILVLRY